MVRHLPTCNEKWSGEDFLRKINSITGRNDKAQMIKKIPLQFAGFFNSDLREIVEMYYQYAEDYFFDSSKFIEKFSFKPKKYAEAIDAIFQK